MRAWGQGISGLVLAIALAPSLFGADAHVVESKLKAKFSPKKITVKGKVVAGGDWPVGLRVEIMNAQGIAIASASDSMRGDDSFKIELTPSKRQRFAREDFLNARVRYSLRRGKKQEESGSVGLAQICPNLTKKKRWWW